MTRKSKSSLARLSSSSSSWTSHSTALAWVGAFSAIHDTNRRSAFGSLRTILSTTRFRRFPQGCIGVGVSGVEISVEPDNGLPLESRNRFSSRLGDPRVNECNISVPELVRVPCGDREPATGNRCGEYRIRQAIVIRHAPVKLHLIGQPSIWASDWCRQNMPSVATPCHRPGDEGGGPHLRRRQVRMARHHRRSAGVLGGTSRGLSRPARGPTPDSRGAAIRNAPLRPVIGTDPSQ